MLLKQITEIYEQSRRTYGWPRVHAELVLGLGVEVNHKRVARLMRDAGVQGLYRRRASRGPTGPATGTTWCTASSLSTLKIGCG